MYVFTRDSIESLATVYNESIYLQAYQDCLIILVTMSVATFSITRIIKC